MEYHIEAGAIAKVPAAFSNSFSGSVPLLVADNNTWTAGGRAVGAAFKQVGQHVDVLVFDDIGRVHADNAHVAQVKQALGDPSRCAIAVGSGTINDIVKLASHQMGKPYMVVPTAPSVDGYTSVGSAMTIGSFKRTIYCPPPRVVMADPEILCNAPDGMIASGFGDLAGKITAGLDWIVADELGLEPVDAHAWNLVQGPLLARLELARALSCRDPAAIVSLFNGLVDSGLAMAAYKDSRPASGTEHLLSHVWEMSGLSVGGDEISHGCKVAFGTLVATALASFLVSLGKEDLESSMDANPGMIWPATVDRIRALCPAIPAVEESLETAKSKHLDGSVLEERRRLILGRWEPLCARIQERMTTMEQLRTWFAVVGCPTEPVEIGLGRALLHTSVLHAQLIRTRYTLLDLAHETGVLERFARLVATSGWCFQSFKLD